MNRDEKGRISPAQSKVALSMRTMGQMAARQGGQKFGKHAYGEVHHGVSGMDRMAALKEANKGKRAKSRVVLRGQKSDYRKAYTKVGARMHKEGKLHAPKQFNYESREAAQAHHEDATKRGYKSSLSQGPKGWKVTF